MTKKKKKLKTKPSNSPTVRKISQIGVKKSIYWDENLRGNVSEFYKFDKSGRISPVILQFRRAKKWRRRAVWVFTVLGQSFTTTTTTITTTIWLRKIENALYRNGPSE